MWYAGAPLGVEHAEGRYYSYLPVDAVLLGRVQYWLEVVIFIYIDICDLLLYARWLLPYCKV